MKIGIITLPLHTNYGGILQAYALQRVLGHMGHKAITIKKESKYKIPLWKTPFVYTKRILAKYIQKKGDAIDIFHEQKSQKTRAIIAQNTQPFIDKYILTQDITEFKRNGNKFDAIIVGSDQVWRPKYFGNIKEGYLSFAKSWKIKRIAYAASFGTSKWEYSFYQSKICKKLINNFDWISIREQSGVYLCKKHFRVNALHVLDPTMLLDTSHYISLIEKAQIKKEEGELFVYVLDENESTNTLERHLCTTLGYTAFYSSTDSYNAVLENRIATKVEVWLRSFFDAKFVLTDSFHACVFSILFNKPFVVYGNTTRGLSRFSSLLRLFKLEDRLVLSDSNELEQIIERPINWSEVNDILEEQRKISNTFLINALEM